MSQVTVGKWGENLAIRFPAKAAGLYGGKRLEIEATDGNIVIRRRPAFHGGGNVSWAKARKGGGLPMQELLTGERMSDVRS